MSDPFRLDGKTAVVLGGAGLIGSIACRALATQGAKVIAADLYDTHDVVGYDIRDQVQMTHLAETTQANILVNAAGIDRGSAAGWPRHSWQDDLDVGLTGCTNACAAFGAMMYQRGRGVILNISSDLGLIGPDQRIYPEGEIKPPSYSAVKHGVVGLTRYYATLLAPHVRVNALAPAGIYNNHDPAFVEKLSARIPLGRMLKADELAGPIVFLCSDAASFITGVILPVDGGRTCW